MKKLLGLIASFALVFSLVLAIPMLSGCGKPDPITYTVNVVDSDGEAVSGVKVELVLDGETEASGTTDASGEAKIEAVPEVYEVKLSNLPSGLAASRAYSTDKDGSVVNVTLNINGYKVNVMHEGENVAGIGVYLQTDAGVTVTSGVTKSNGAVLTVVERNEYIVALDIPAPYVFVANKEEGSNGYYRVSDENPTVTINLDVEDVTYGAVVRTSLGTPVEGAEIEVLKKGEVEETLTTDSEGRIEFTLPAYAYELKLLSSIDGYIALGSDTKTLKITGEEVAFNVAPQGTEAVAYSVTVDNIGGRLMEGMKVAFYKDNTFISHANTNSDGVAVAYLASGNYDVTVEDLPLGYAVQGEDFISVSESNNQISITLTTEVIKDQTPDRDFTYSLGDVMYDFTIETTEGELTLSEILEEKDLVVINLWATWCGPCRQEFPALFGAYLQYSDVVEVIAISTSDSLDACYDFAADGGLEGMPFAEDNGVYPMLSRFSANGIPTTVFIDRYGVITEAHTGSIVVQGEWSRIFDRYIADDYVQQIGSSGEGGQTGENSDEREKPDIINPNVESIAQALNSESVDFTYYFEPEDSADFEYSWPWLPKANGEGIYASNVRQSDRLLNFTFANIHTTFTAEAGDVIAFDYDISTETGYDVLYVIVDGQIMQQLSGDRSGTCFAYVVPVDGEYTMSLCYNKDRVTAYEGEKVEISNMRIVTEDDINVPTNIFRYAAFGENEDYTATNDEMKFNHYVDVVYNAEDGLYHVYNQNGPLLLAVITQYGTQWNPNTTIFNIANDGNCVFNGIDYGEIIAGSNSFAHLAAWSDIEGYVPVNLEMADILKLMAANLGDKKGTYDEATGDANSVWLEMCVYYDYYGPEGGEMQNPIIGLGTHTAIELHEGDNDVVIHKTPVPRGIYHSFTAEETGYYEMMSTGNAQSLAWIMREVVDEFGFKTYVMQGTNGSSGYFDMNEEGEWVYIEDFRYEVYLEEGETVYLLLTMFAHPATGEYNVRITHLGNESSGMLVAAGEGPHAFNEATGEWYAVNCIDFMLGEDGYYHHRLEDGTEGGIIYLNMTGETYMFTNGETMEDFIDGVTLPNDDNEPTLYSFNLEDVMVGGEYGEDWTSAMEEYLAEAEANEGYYNGFVAVDEELYEIMLFFTRYFFTPPTADATLSPNSWLLACSYELI